MLNKPISYKFIPALATLLCACAPAQAGINLHFGVDFPIGGPVIRPMRPVCPVYPMPIYVAPRVRPASDMLIAEIQHDLNAIHADLHSSCFSCDGYNDLINQSRCIKNNWTAWVRGYRYAFGVNRYDLEAVSDEVRDIRFEISRLRSVHVHLCHYEYNQVRSLLMNITDIVGSCHRYRTSDLCDVTMYLSQIQRILAHS